MDINQPTLIQFESARKQHNLIPPLGSNSFYSVGDGEVNIFCLRNLPDNYRFDLIIYKGIVYTGIGNFYAVGDIKDIDMPYRDLTVLQDTELHVNQGLTISSGKMEVFGKLELMQHSRLFIKNKGTAVFDVGSVLTVNKSSGILLEAGASLIIYGTINIDVAELDSILNNTNITIDSSAILNVTGISYDNKQFSLTQYESELKRKDINVNTQGEKNYDNGKGRIGYRWRDGKPLEHSYVLDITQLLGEVVLGDLRFAVTGFPAVVHSKSQTIGNLIIKKNTTLNITESYRGSTYMRPELYLGIVIENSKTPATCTVHGKIICDGLNTMISVDRKASIRIAEGGEVHLRNGAIMRSTYNENAPVLFIDGTLIIEDISQVKTFEKENIVFGPKGKVIVLNPDIGKKRLLFTTPNGIKNSDLYRLFIDSIDHIEYHISNNTGIGIDQYYEFYGRDMQKWFGDRRIEKAIKDGILVWHSGGYIELYHDITPWATKDSTLLHASRLFKSFGSYDKDKLQDTVNRLNYAGCGDILFRFIDGDIVKEVILSLESIHMKNIFNDPSKGKYVLHTDSDGLLFMRNSIGDCSINTLINPKSRIIEIVDKKAEFLL